MMDAVKRLYMLGNRPASHKKVNLGDDIEEGLGSIKDGYDRFRQKEDAAKQLRTVEKYAGDVGGVGRSMRGGAADYATLATEGPEAYENLKERREVAAGRALPVNAGKSYEDAMSALEKNEMAANARIGGQYTLQGLKQTQKDADDQGHDMVYGKYLHGLGGSMAPQPITAPPDYMRDYRINGGF
jgi:hypothetical protein